MKDSQYYGLIAFGFYFTSIFLNIFFYKIIFFLFFSVIYTISLILLLKENKTEVHKLKLNYNMDLELLKTLSNIDIKLMEIKEILKNGK